MAYYDSLTELPNRGLFLDRLNQAIYLSQRTNKKIAVLFLDLDSFKFVNDTMGHQAGDELIVQISKKLFHTLRKSDTVSSFGGDEFLIMLNNINNKKEIYKIAEK